MTYIPLLPLDAQTVDEANYRLLPVGTPVKTWHEAFLPLPGAYGGWKLTTFWTKDGQRVTGRTHYRAARTWRGRLRLAGPLARKWWSRWTSKAPSP